MPPRAVSTIGCVGLPLSVASSQSENAAEYRGGDRRCFRLPPLWLARLDSMSNNTLNLRSNTIHSRHMNPGHPERRKTLGPRPPITWRIKDYILFSRYRLRMTPYRFRVFYEYHSESKHEVLDF